MSTNEDWMRHASTDAPRIKWATVNRIGCVTHPVMRHASSDASRIQSSFQTSFPLPQNDELALDAPRIQKNQRPRFHYTTRTALMRHASIDASRIQIFPVPDYKRDREQFIQTQPSFRHCSQFCQISFFWQNPLTILKRSAADCWISTWIEDVDYNETENQGFKSSTTGFSDPFSLFLIYIFKMLDLVMLG